MQSTRRDLSHKWPCTTWDKWDYLIIKSWLLTKGGFPFSFRKQTIQLGVASYADESRYFTKSCFLSLYNLTARDAFCGLWISCEWFRIKVPFTIILGFLSLLFSLRETTGTKKTDKKEEGREVASTVCIWLSIIIAHWWRVLGYISRSI